MLDFLSLCIVILDDTFASACKEHMKCELTPVLSLHLSVCIKHANLLVHSLRTPIASLMGDQLLDDASDGCSAFSFGCSVDDVGFLRVLGDVRREELIIELKEAILSVCERVGPLFVRCYVGGGKSGVQINKGNLLCYFLILDRSRSHESRVVRWDLISGLLID